MHTVKHDCNQHHERAAPAALFVFLSLVKKLLSNQHQTVNGQRQGAIFFRVPPTSRMTMQRLLATKLIGAIVLLFWGSSTARAQVDVELLPEVTITDSDIEAGQSIRWSADSVYVLDGAVFVEDGAALHIPAGAVVKAMDGQSVNASALVITRGGKIYAEGTAEKPIIFTSIQDNISSPDLLTYEDRGLWGGIVILGHASTNNPGDSNGDFKEIEGVNEILPDGDRRAEYGGADDADNSGVMRYVSIRHTGINIGESDGNEIQGLTLGGVGSGTTLEYIESYASGDDGVEFFGGTVDLKYFVSAFNADDAVDWDQGWRGKGQFWFVLQGVDKAGAAAEMDGAGGDEHFKPYATPTIYNVTYIGAGVGNQPAGDRAEMLMFRDNTGGSYQNSIFHDFQSSEGGFALTIEDIDNTGSKTEDSRQRFEAGDLQLTNNIWGSFGAGTEPAALINKATDAFKVAVFTYLAQNGNRFADPMLRGIERDVTGSGQLDPRPLHSSPALTAERAAYPAGDAFFSDATFIGAFGANNWANQWTALASLGYFGDLPGGPTAIEAVDTDVPTGIILRQNYPNPFNPETTIEFAVPRAQNVRLAIYDMLGREVAVLLNGRQVAGAYQVHFDAWNYNSGMYLYRLETEAGTITKTMLLLE